MLWDVQGQELVIDEDEAAIEALPARQLAPPPDPPAASGGCPLELPQSTFNLPSLCSSRSYLTKAEDWVM